MVKSDPDPTKKTPDSTGSATCDLDEMFHCHVLHNSTDYFGSESDIRIIEFLYHLLGVSIRSSDINSAPPTPPQPVVLVNPLIPPPPTSASSFS